MMKRGRNCTLRKIYTALDICVCLDVYAYKMDVILNSSNDLNYCTSAFKPDGPKQTKDYRSPRQQDSLHESMFSDCVCKSTHPNSCS